MKQVRTPHNSTRLSNVKVLYGNPVARELLEVELTDDSYKFSMSALITNPNYSSKRMTFLLFINHRLVESTRECSKISKAKRNNFWFENFKSKK